MTSALCQCFKNLTAFPILHRNTNRSRVTKITRDSVQPSSRQRFGRCDAQPLDFAGHEVRTRRCHRIDHYRQPRTLKAVHRADTVFELEKHFDQCRNLRVVGDDERIAPPSEGRNLLRFAAPSGPQQFGSDILDHRNFFHGSGPSAGMWDSTIPSLFALSPALPFLLGKREE